MCGIAGLLNQDGTSVTAGDLKRMKSILAHRGPDGEGIHIDGELGFSHSRLAILDLSDAGQQPMSYENKRYWITYNGEIFNFIELRKILEEKGYTFHSQTDTEVILASYAEWGSDCVHRFNGMWAFALWDSKERQLFISRDRFGIKPLYYYIDQKVFAFSSEIKGFLGVKSIDLKPTPDGLATAIEFSNVMDGMEMTPYEKVRRLLPGHNMVLNAGDPTLNIKRWWKTLEHLPEVHPLPVRQDERLRELLYDSCRLRMRSDVPTGTCLSGGIDSSSIFGVLNSMAEKPPITEQRFSEKRTAYIVRFSGSDNSEQDLAEKFARSTGANLEIIEVSAEDAFENIEDIIYSLEDAAGFNLAQWLLYKLVREKGTFVSLDGHGGDECFGGYPLNARYRAVDVTNELISTAEMINKISDRPSDWETLVKKGRVPDITGLSYDHRFQLNKANFDPYALRGRPNDYYSPIWEEDFPLLNDMDLSFRIIYYQGHGGFLQWNLRTYDMVSMAHGVEVRIPFLDWRLYCYCLALPTERKMGQGYSKLALRTAMRGIVPQKILDNKRKIGFLSPLQRWLAGPHQSMLKDYVYSRSFLSSELWDGYRVSERFVGGAQSSSDNNLHLTVWPYVQAHLLNERFKQTRKSVFQDMPPERL